MAATMWFAGLVVSGSLVAAAPQVGAPTPAFFAVAAQVIPVLVLALGIEMSALSVRPLREPEANGIGVAVALTLALGEACTLLAVYLDSRSTWLAAQTSIALLVGLALVIAFAVSGPHRVQDSRSRALSLLADGVADACSRREPSARRAAAAPDDTCI